MIHKAGLAKRQTNGARMLAAIQLRARPKNSSPQTSLPALQQPNPTKKQFANRFAVSASNSAQSKHPQTSHPPVSDSKQCIPTESSHSSPCTESKQVTPSEHPQTSLKLQSTRSTPSENSQTSSEIQSKRCSSSKLSRASAPLESLRSTPSDHCYTSPNPESAPPSLPSPTSQSQEITNIPTKKPRLSKLDPSRPVSPQSGRKTRSETIKERETLQKLGTTGIINTGNSCYFNSLLQSLLSLSCFMKDIDQLSQLSPDASFSKAIVEFRQQMKARSNLIYENESADPSELQQLFFQKSKFLPSKLQEDAHDVFMEFLEIISKEAPAYYHCPVVKNFSFIMMSRFNCRSCSHQSPLYQETWNQMSLPIPSTKNTTSLVSSKLSSLLDDYFAPELLTYTCEKCNGNQAEKRTSLRTYPRVFVIHLNRFTFSPDTEEKYVKVHTPFEIPMYLNLDPYLAETANGPEIFSSPYIGGGNSVESLKDFVSALSDKNDTGLSDSPPSKLHRYRADLYRISSIVRHLGNSVSSGHYVSHIFNHVNGTWRKCDDTHVTLAHDDNPWTQTEIQKDSYMLYYEHADIWL